MDLKSAGTYVYTPGAEEGPGTFGHYTAPQALYLMSIGASGAFDYEGVRFNPVGMLGMSFSGGWLHAGSVTRAGGAADIPAAAFAIADASGAQSWDTATKYVPVEDSGTPLTAPEDGSSTTVALRPATPGEDGLMHIAPGQYDFGLYFGHANPRLTLTRTLNQTEAQVPVPDSLGAEAEEYYSIHGVRIHEVAKGLVVRRQRSRSSLIYRR